MRKLWFGAFSLIALYGCTSTTAPVSLFSSLPSGVSLVEKVDAQPGKSDDPVLQVPS